ncbi:MAG: peptidylprolyl isomerase [Candidatus Nealsonbacteria bacterium]|nr:peptidylprolyl isomerase [Candidatus Nealsonbacteria bacterium]
MTAKRSQNSTRRHNTRIPLAAAVAACFCIATSAAQSESADEADVVVATIGDEPIYARDVERLLKKATGGKDVNPAALPVLQAQVLLEIVDRRLVAAYARRTKSDAPREQIDAAVKKLESQLASQGSSLDGYLRQRSIGEADLRRQIAWRSTWPKFLARYITPERLETHFKAHRREFDGTELSVSQILLRPDAAGAKTTAESIRGEIVAGKIDFAEAARKHSAAPSGKDGGRLGWIARHDAMGETFSRAAFALQVGQVSKPVVTRFGVHLIRCDEIKPGNKTAADAGAQLEEALARELLGRLARLQRRYTAVKYTGAMPHFKPGTRELVVP